VDLNESAFRTFLFMKMCTVILYRMKRELLAHQLSVCITVELHLSGHFLSGSPIIWIGLVLGVNLSRMLQN